MKEPFSSLLGPELLTAMQKGVMRYTYRKVPCLKSPLDMAIYLKLLTDLRPATIIEIGAKFGGSALWFADMSRVLYAPARIVSFDNQPKMPELTHPGIEFIRGDARRLGDAVAPAFWDELPRPWLVVEDSAHTYNVSTAVLKHFEPLIQPGEYIVIEDGVVRAMPGPKPRAYEDGPCRAIADFLRCHPDFEIDRALCDMYGRNVTYNPGGYLRRAHREDEGQTAAVTAR